MIRSSPKTTNIPSTVETGEQFGRLRRRKFCIELLGNRYFGRDRRRGGVGVDDVGRKEETRRYRVGGREVWGHLGLPIFKSERTTRIQV